MVELLKALVAVRSVKTVPMFIDVVPMVLKLTPSVERWTSYHNSSRPWSTHVRVTPVVGETAVMVTLWAAELDAKYWTELPAEVVGLFQIPWLGSREFWERPPPLTGSLPRMGTASFQLMVY